jgi:hypothetical protein
MSIHGILLLDLVGLVFMLAVVRLVRSRGLSVAYGALWIGALVLMILVVSIRPLLGGVTRAVGATYPASALTLLAFLLAFGILIFFSVQLSKISARQIELAQEFALRELRSRESRQRTPDDAEWKR